MALPFSDQLHHLFASFMSKPRKASGAASMPLGHRLARLEFAVPTSASSFSARQTRYCMCSDGTLHLQAAAPGISIGCVIGVGWPSCSQKSCRTPQCSEVVHQRQHDASPYVLKVAVDACGANGLERSDRDSAITRLVVHAGVRVQFLNRVLAFVRPPAMPMTRQPLPLAKCRERAADRAGGGADGNSFALIGSMMWTRP
jgi:hypothetical protein